MASVLMLYGTSEGQTAAVAERMAGVVEATGHDVALLNAKHLPADFSLADYDAAMIGGSIHMGSQPEAIRRLVDEAVETLNAMPTAFFSVSLSAAGDEEGQADAEGLIHDFLDETGFEPDRTLSVAGALKYSEYGLLTKFMMKRIARKEGGDTDTSRDWEYTDWDSVEAFAAAFASSLA
ncbi:flavodoxin [Salinarchaeum sp. Harcht-Bsk1]|uniref:flavodoxin domain-containing protein n=1 Tax=Salinarchaeum sp. Harcht-Bsk1 TaxID=1333523 RepID=UPI0003424334|nr:flavodoxin domain-containing protein [Salinarchaeum sp. Harcht-Bsk1]AGN02081.1 flavodoxin [Salinarchaeum sp. Harcht-Bsk1]